MWGLFWGSVQMEEDARKGNKHYWDTADDS